MIDRRSGMRGTLPLQLGDMVRGRVVQTEMSFVAEEEHRGCREALGHRGDAEDGVGGRERLLPHDRRTHAAGMDEFAADDHTVCDAGHRLFGDEPVDEPVHLRQRVVDRHAPDYSRA